MADLKFIEDGLDDRKIAQEIENRIDMALKVFPVPAPTVPNFGEMERLAAEFYQFLMHVYFGAVVSDIQARGFVILLLSRAFPAGLEDAADMATLGVNGGVLEVLRRIAEAIKAELTKQQIKGTIATGVDLSSWDDRVALMSSYLQKYSHLSPTQRKKTAEELALRAEALMESHMQLAKYFRKNLGR